MGRLKDYLTDEVTCPTCDARPGQRCITPSSRAAKSKMAEAYPESRPASMVEVRWLHHSRQP